MFTKQQQQQPQFRSNEFHMVRGAFSFYFLFLYSSHSLSHTHSLSIFLRFFTSTYIFWVKKRRRATESMALKMNLMILFKIIIILSNYMIIIPVNERVAAQQCDYANYYASHSFLTLSAGLLLLLHFINLEFLLVRACEFYYTLETPIWFN